MSDPVAELARSLKAENEHLHLDIALDWERLARYILANQPRIVTWKPFPTRLMINGEPPPYLYMFDGPANLVGDSPYKGREPPEMEPGI